MPKEECAKKYFVNCPCPDFEMCINEIKYINSLKQIRKVILTSKLKTDNSLSGKIADFLVNKVGTMACFYCFIVLATIPVIFPNLMSVVQYIASSYLQLILLPLIMVATNRADSIRQQKNEREWKINLINSKIDELNKEEEMRFQQIQLEQITKNDLVQSSE